MQTADKKSMHKMSKVVEKATRLGEGEKQLHVRGGA